MQLYSMTYERLHGLSHCPRTLAGQRTDADARRLQLAPSYAAVGLRASTRYGCSTADSACAMRAAMRSPKGDSAAGAFCSRISRPAVSRSRKFTTLA